MNQRPNGGSWLGRTYGLVLDMHRRPMNHIRDIDCFWVNIGRTTAHNLSEAVLDFVFKVSNAAFSNCNDMVGY